MNLRDFRAKYPQYEKVPDQQLAEGLYKRYYADKVDRSAFYRELGVAPEGETVLPPEQEADYFLRWKQQNAPNDSGQDYDLRGAYQAEQAGDLPERDERGHMPDTFKKPNHPTFSDQSKYNGVNGEQGGRWGTDDQGNTTFTPGPANLKRYTQEELQQYFAEREPGVKLVMPNEAPPEQEFTVSRAVGNAIKRTADPLDPTLTKAREYARRGFAGEVGDALVSGATKTDLYLRAAGWLTAGETADADQLAMEIAKATEAAPPRAAAAEQFDQELKDAGWRWREADGVRDKLAAAGEALGAVITNPRAVTLSVAEQISNFVPALVGGAGGAVTGAIGGAAAGGPAGAAMGATIYGAAGMAGGEIAVETGAKVLELLTEAGVDLRDPTQVANALKSPGFRQAAQKAGLIKGSVIAAVDVATMKAGGALLSAPARELEQKVSTYLLEMGVDITDKAAVDAALAAPAAKQALAGAFEQYLGRTTMGSTSARAAGAMGIETAGEGLGEGLGETAAGGQTSFEDVTQEMIGSLGQSAMQTGVEATTGAITGLTSSARRAAKGAAEPVGSEPYTGYEPSVNDLFGEPPSPAAGPPVVDETSAMAGREPPTAITDANSPAVRGQVEEITPEEIEAAPAPPAPALLEAEEQLRAEIDALPPAANIDVEAQDLPVEAIEAAPAPAEPPTGGWTPPSNVDVQEHRVDEIDAAAAPTADEILETEEASAEEIAPTTDVATTQSDTAADSTVAEASSPAAMAAVEQPQATAPKPFEGFTAVQSDEIRAKASTMSPERFQRWVTGRYGTKSPKAAMAEALVPTLYEPPSEDTASDASETPVDAQANRAPSDGGDFAQDEPRAAGGKQATGETDVVQPSAANVPASSAETGAQPVASESRPLYSLSNDELTEMHQAQRDADLAAASKAFGSEEKARVVVRALDSNDERSFKKAEAEIEALPDEVRAALEQQLYHTGESTESIREYQRAHSDVMMADTPEELARTLRTTITDIGDADFANIAAARPGEQVAMRKMQWAFERAQREGWDTKAISEAAIKAAAGRFSDPNDAEFMLRRFLPADPIARPDIDAIANEAATSPKNALPEPTDAQKEAGNYRKAHVRVGGLDISIENPAGSKRRPEWPELKSHYGYVKRTEGADGDHVDVFVKPGTAEDFAGDVYVVDQVDPKTHAFDEHKVLVGFDSDADARRGYAENYTKGWKGLDHVTRMTMDEFKAWLASGDTKKALKPKAHEVTTPHTRLKWKTLTEWNEAFSELERRHNDHISRKSYEDIDAHWVALHDNSDLVDASTDEAALQLLHERAKKLARNVNKSKKELAARLIDLAHNRLRQLQQERGTWVDPNKAKREEKAGAAPRAMDYEGRPVDGNRQQARDQVIDKPTQTIETTEPDLATQAEQPAPATPAETPVDYAALMTQVSPALLRRIRVQVDQMVESEGVKRVEVSAADALKDIRRETAAFQKLLKCVGG